MSNIGRNDPCHCGSGKKYKKCCLPRDQAAQPRRRAEAPEKHFIAEVRPDLDDAVDHVLERLEMGAGRAVGAEIVALLEKHPHYHTTNFAMGVYLAMAMHDPVGALPFFEKAVEIFPPFPEAHYNLAGAARKTGDITKAVLAYRAAARYSYDDDGIAELADGELRAIEEALLQASPFPSLDAYLANARLFEEAFQRLAARDFEEAIRLFERVLSENPTHVQSYGNLALAHAGLGRRALALECLERALALDPDYGPALSNRPVLMRMREGEPFNPAIQETNFYAEQLTRAR